MFMFQWPKLPELYLSIGDFKNLESQLRSEPMVCCHVTIQSCDYNINLMMNWIRVFEKTKVT